MNKWLDAAERINDNVGPFHTGGACHAIGYSDGYRETIDKLAEWFMPEGACKDNYWWAIPQDTNADQEARRLALCFMHWIERTES